MNNESDLVGYMPKHDIAKLLQRITGIPLNLASRIRRLVFVLTGGRRFIDLKTHIVGLKTHIVDLRAHIVDLKAHVDAHVATRTLGDFSLSHSFRELVDSVADPQRIAFLTNLPPDTTGIATCSFYSWLGHTGPVDLFCPVDDVDWFLGNSLRLKATSQSRMRVFDVGTFLAADQINNYKIVVIATGNSNHCLYIHAVLKKAAALGGLERFVLYVHDACLLNLIQRGAMLNTAELHHTLESIYNRRIKLDPADLESDGALYAALIRAGVFGMRYFANAGIRRYLVNSQAAFEMVRSDLSSADTKISKVFHPVFLPTGANSALDIARRREATGAYGTFVIGTFGIPGPSKLTDRIIAVAHAIRRRGIDVRLIIAGFEVRAFAQSAVSDLADLSVTVFDGPTDVQLLRCMAEVDVAVQLRLQNLGESSGIVPMLLALGKSVLVSDIGSFKEFGQAVRTIPIEASVAEMTDVILDMRNRPVPQKCIRDYVNAHTPDRFREALISSLDD